VPPDTAPTVFQPFDMLNIRIFESPFLSGVEVQAEDPTRNPHREAEIRPAELSAVKSELAGKYLVPKCPDRALNTRLSFPRGASEGDYTRQGVTKILDDSGRRRPTFISHTLFGVRLRHL
jgi:hypothetical protein